MQRHADRRVGCEDSQLRVRVGEVEAVTGDVELDVSDAPVVASDQLADDRGAEHRGVELERGVSSGDDEVGPQAHPGGERGFCGGHGASDAACAAWFEKVGQSSAQGGPERGVGGHRLVRLVEHVEGVSHHLLLPSGPVGWS